MGHEGCHVARCRGSCAATRMLTIQSKHGARKNLMHNANQTVNSHTENFMRSEMHCSLEEVGTTETC